MQVDKRQELLAGSEEEVEFRASTVGYCTTACDAMNCC